jgi:hypothetical protein
MHLDRIVLVSAVALTSALLCASAHAASAATAVRVCVEVVPKTWKETPAEPSAGAPKHPPNTVPMTEESSWLAQQSAAMQKDAGAPKPPVRPSDQAEVRPELYLKRLLEYEVTHDEAYDAVKEGCTERMSVELYELRDGWTVFGRFSLYAREEKIDHVKLDEFAALAQRMAVALLHDRSIDQTITRHNVLRDDSEGATRSVRGSAFVQFGLGTSARVGYLPTASNQARDAATAEELRLLTPLAFTAAYRGKFRTWGLEAFGRLYLGTTQRAANTNLLGGHADYSGGAALGLHFLRYTDSAAMNSIYYGGGASFELQRFTTIVPNADVQGGDTRLGLYTGGLDLDLVLGYEFMRASSIHFYTQLDINGPLYVLESENTAGRIRTYMPGAEAQVGILF